MTWIKCPICEVELKEKNLKDHFRRVHPDKYKEKYGEMEKKQKREASPAKTKYPFKKEDLTVLDDFTMPGEPNEVSHREAGAMMLRKLREKMTEDEWIELKCDLDFVVTDLIFSELEANFLCEDFWDMGLQEPWDILNAEKVADAIGKTALFYFEDDQLGKSNDILDVIFEYAKKYDVIESDHKE